MKCQLLVVVLGVWVGGGGRIFLGRLCGLPLLDLEVVSADGLLDMV